MSRLLNKNKTRDHGNLGNELHMLFTIFRTRNVTFYTVFQQSKPWNDPTELCSVSTDKYAHFILWPMLGAYDILPPLYTAVNHFPD